jgi:hypothetical protein
MVYSFSSNSVAYPSIESARNDVRVNMQSFQLLVHTRDNSPMVYKGGIKFSWGKESWLFNKDFSSVSSYNSTQLVGLEVKRVGDHQKYIAASDHYIGISLPRDFLAGYKLSLLRDSKTYDFHYPSGGVEQRNYDDNDRITINHHLSISRQGIHRINGEAYGDYSEYIVSYLFKENSSKNATENSFRAGINATCRPTDYLIFSENITADAEVTDYQYAFAHRGDSTLVNFDPPPAQRSFSSLFTGQWKIGNNWGIDWKWTERYYDRGKWYGKEYLSVDTLKSNYYAIETWTRDHSFEASLDWDIALVSMKGGGMFRVNDDQVYFGSTQKYGPITNGLKYFAEPFCEVQIGFKRFMFKGRVAHMFNRLVNTKNWEPGGDWDLHLVGTAQW